MSGTIYEKQFAILTFHIDSTEIDVQSYHYYIFKFTVIHS